MTPLEQQLYEALKRIDELTTGSLPVTYLIKEIVREAKAEYERQLEQETPKASY